MRTVLGVAFTVIVQGLSFNSQLEGLVSTDKCQENATRLEQAAWQAGQLWSGRCPGLEEADLARLEGNPHAGIVFPRITLY